MKILNLIIALQLILLQLPLSVNSTIVYAQSADSSADCPEGMYFHMQLNRCVLKQKVQNTKVKASKCASLEGDAYRKCYEKNITDEMAGEEETSEVKDGSEMRYGIPMVASLVAGYYLLRLKLDKRYGSKQKCFTGSMWLILGGGLNAIMTEISAQGAYKERLREIEEDYKANIETNQSTEIENDEGGAQKATNAQTLALEYMIEQEEARKTAAKRRKSGYLISTVAYTAGAALAIYEQVQTGTMQMGACTAHDVEVQPGDEEIQTEGQTSTHYTPDKRNKINIDEILVIPEMYELFADYSHHKSLTFEEMTEVFKRKIAEFSSALIPNAHADDNDTDYSSVNTRLDMGNIFNNIPINPLPDPSPEPGPGPTPGPPSPINVIIQPQVKKYRTLYGNMIDRAISTPWIRAALAGVLAGYSVIMMNKAKENMEIADRRIAMLKEIKADFEASGGVQGASYCTDRDRRNPTKPNCYCYNEDGTVNKVRKNRDVCKFYIANKGFMRGDYKALKGIGYNPMKSCLKSDGEIDPGCGICSRDPKQCEIIPALTVNGMTMGSTKVFGQTMKSLNDFNNGGLNASNLNEANIERQIAAFDKIRDKLSKDPRFKDANKKSKDFANKLRGATLKASQGSQNAIKAIIGSAGGAGSAALGNQLQASLGKDVKEKLDKVKEAQFTSGGNDGAKAAAKSGGGDDFDFGFGSGDMGAEGGVEIEGEVADVMDKKFKFGQNDINKNKNGDIFKILSIRYQRSAFIRLFDDKGEFKADEASNTDINSGNQ